MLNSHFIKLFCILPKSTCFFTTWTFSMLLCGIPTSTKMIISNISCRTNITHCCLAKWTTEKNKAPFMSIRNMSHGDFPRRFVRSTEGESSTFFNLREIQSLNSKYLRHFITGTIYCLFYKWNIAGRFVTFSNNCF